MTQSPPEEPRQWWVQRWLELLDSYRFKKRLERARNYAREGHVLSLDFADNQLLAQVQGSEETPYQVTLQLAVFSDEDWQYVLSSLAAQAIFSAQLLAGQMPVRIEQVFIKNGLSLFPYTLSEVRSHCSCPDQANPCKHIGAVYYQLGDRFREDPFIIFQLRGRTKAQILEALRILRSANLEPLTSAAKTPEEIAHQASPLSSSGEHFWDYDLPLDTHLVTIVPPERPSPLWERIGPPPLSPEVEQELKQVLLLLQNLSHQQALEKISLTVE
jgi:uncharacterized Zn finger protein